jgi:hypothetical protein
MRLNIENVGIFRIFFRHDKHRRFARMTTCVIVCGADLSMGVGHSFCALVDRNLFRREFGRNEAMAKALKCTGWHADLCEAIGLAWANRPRAPKKEKPKRSEAARVACPECGKPISEVWLRIHREKRHGVGEVEGAKSGGGEG